MTAPAPTGVTLIEMLIALTLLGLTAAVVGLAIPRRDPPSQADVISHAVANARGAAIDSGHSVTISLLVGGVAHAATALADGSIVADSGIVVDRLSGTPPSATAKSDPINAQ